MSFEQRELVEDTQMDKYLTISVADQGYGIDIRSVTEIIGIQPVSILPEVPEFVKGVINLRGRIIPVVDMRLRFGQKEEAYTDRTCIVVVETKRLTAGLIVDQVSEVMSINAESIVPLPDVQFPDSHRYICGIGKVGAEVKLLIDCDRLINDNEAKSMERN